MMAKKIKLFLCNALWCLTCLPDWIHFHISLLVFPIIQKKRLLQIVKQNKNTEFGEKYHFPEIYSIEDFQKNVPILEYEDYRPYIQKIEAGKRQVLTQEPVLLLEPTSGSSGKAKYIPYTKKLKKAFQKAVNVWLLDIFIHNPKMLLGKSYWSVTPKQAIETTGKIKIGFEEDAQYLSSFSQSLMKHVMVAMPENMATENYLHTILETLKNEKQLTFISVWSPTFIDCLLKNIDFTPEQHWKNICLISSWGDACSEAYLSLIEKYFPNTKIQPKGLLSTECIVSFPLHKIENKAILAYQSHFFEFKDLTGKICLGHQLQQENTYTVIVTTSGGLYRYNTNDTVKVTGFYKKLPILKFIGRANNVSDFFGEKLHEIFVREACKVVFSQINIQPIFFVVIFEKNHYTLLLEDDFADNQLIETLLEEELETNYHYKNCILIGQLTPVKCRKIDDGINKYTAFYVEKGLKAGDIKMKVLDTMFFLQ